MFFFRRVTKKATILDHWGKKGPQAEDIQKLMEEDLKEMAVSGEIVGNNIIKSQDISG